MESKIKGLAVVATSMAACVGSSAPAARPAPADQRHMVERLEADISRNGDKHLTSKTVRIGDIRKYARFYTFKYYPKVMGMYRLPVPDAPGYGDHRTGIYIVEDFGEAGVGGNCSTTLYIAVRDLKHLEYEISCGAR